MEGFTLASVLSSIGDVFGAAIDMVGDVASTIAGQPMLLLYALIPICGIGVGMFKRLLHVN